MRIEELRESRNENELKCNILQLTRLVFFSLSEYFYGLLFISSFHPKKIIYILSRISLCVLTFKIVVVFGVAFLFSFEVCFFLYSYQSDVRSMSILAATHSHTHTSYSFTFRRTDFTNTYILVYLHKACSAEALYLSISPSSNAARHTKPFNSIMKQQSKQFEWQSLFFSFFCSSVFNWGEETIQRNHISHL